MEVEDWRLGVERSELRVVLAGPNQISFSTELHIDGCFFVNQIFVFN